MTILKFIYKYWKYVLIFIAFLFLGQKFLDLHQENKRLHEELIGKTQKYEQLGEYAAKLEIKYKNQDALLKELNNKWDKQREELEGRIKVLSDATFLIKEKARETDNSDVVFN